MSDLEDMNVMLGKLNTENRIENEVTIDISRFINTEISQQMSKNLDELKRDSNTQITASISSSI